MPNLDAFLRDLGRTLPDGTLVTDRDILASYARDEGEVAPQEPGAVVRARSAAHIRAVLEAATRHRVPVTPRAGGTCRVGAATPVEGGVVLSVERMASIKEIDRRNLTAVVEPGVVTATLQAAAEAEGLFYGPDPNSAATCMIGGNIATNAGGPRAFKYGVTREYVLGLEVITGGGERLRLGRQTAKGVTGYDLTALVVGSEGTLAVIAEATLRLIPRPEGVATMLVLLPSEAAVAKAVEFTASRRVRPRCVELLDSVTLDVVRSQAALSLPAAARALLIVEVDGELSELDAQMERCGNAMTDAGAMEVLVARHGGDRERLWAARREMTRTLRTLRRHKLSEDICVPISRTAELLEGCREIAAAAEILMPVYGHAGDGNLHVNFLWNADDEWPRVKAAVAEVFRRTLALGGTLTGEHGIGVVKAPYLPLEQSPALIDLEERVKGLFDPAGILNPGKIFPGAAKTLHGAC